MSALTIPTLSIVAYLIAGVMIYVAGFYVLKTTPDEILKMEKDEYERKYDQQETVNSGE